MTPDALKANQSAAPSSPPPPVVERTPRDETPTSTSLPVVERAQRDETRTQPPATFDWRRRYARRLAATDAIAIIWVVFGTQIAWLGLDADLTTRSRLQFGDSAYWIFSALLVIAWLTALALNDSRSYRVIGVGPTEYKRIFDASFTLFGGIAILAFLLRIDVARGFLLISLPLGVAVLFAERWLWRQWLVGVSVSSSGVMLLRVRVG